MRYSLLAAGIAAACLAATTTATQASHWRHRHHCCHAPAPRGCVEEAVLSRYIACYTKHYVPARVLVNTRGKLVRPGGVTFEVYGGPTAFGSRVGPYERWDKVRVLPVYKEVRTVLEPDHYTLRRVGC